MLRRKHMPIQKQLMIVNFLKKKTMQVTTVSFSWYMVEVGENQFITRRRVMWPHLPQFQGFVAQGKALCHNPETVVNEATLPFFF